ncbi:ubiquinol-cytochrome-c reductase complex subunit-domain-containing protein [Podospora fimiseda]|uniref:Ubiquinol-cytochrome-c reductase complex subunit-domain-containing protein n=1 Tax=Podospora fimiseda TaxID=252190 RepID=A0AAN7H4P6_9PEZI|nr:ubiquinol-cytochrome-c reductase complex subunit-domain-containing protein [Podospora fimiseda]
MPFASPILRAAYPEYKSPYGPKYHYQPHVGTITAKTLTRFGVNAGRFGGVALFTVVFFASGIPRLHKDVLFNIPVVGRVFENYFDKKVPASDSPF